MSIHLGSSSLSHGDTLTPSSRENTPSQQTPDPKSLRSLLLGIPQRVSDTVHELFDRIPSSYQELMETVNERSERWQNDFVRLLEITTGLLEKGLLLKGEGWYGERKKMVEYAIGFQSRKGVELLSHLVLRMRRELE
ncbi:MAG: hypothetical protein HHAS10_00520 [Candidatus Altimarinota bacterium]